MYKSRVNDFKDAIRLAEQEIADRPHPTSFVLLAWVIYKSGEKEKALPIVKEHVTEQATEPFAFISYGHYFSRKQSARKSLTLSYLTKALNSSFELGPVIVVKSIVIKVSDYKNLKPRNI